MILDELLSKTRKVLDDIVEPYRWTDAELVGYLNDVVEEVCVRTRSIVDSSSSLCSVTFAAGATAVTLDPCIYSVRRVRIDGSRDPLDLTDTKVLDDEYPGWDDSTIYASGTPVACIFDYDERRLRLFRTPSEDTVLRLQVWRGPNENELLEVGDDQGEPVLPALMQRELHRYAAAQAWLDGDEERMNHDQAAKQLAMFEEAYGPKPSLHEIRSWSVQKRRKTRSHYY